MLGFEVHTDGLDAMGQNVANACTKAEHIVALQVKKDTSPFMPALTGSFNARTRVEKNKIVYPGPFAGFLYKGKLMVDPDTGSPFAKKGAVKVLTDKNLVFNKSVHAQAQSHWFEASKAQNLDKWIRVSDKVVKRGI